MVTVAKRGRLLRINRLRRFARRTGVTKSVVGTVNGKMPMGGGDFDPYAISKVYLSTSLAARAITRERADDNKVIVKKLVEQEQLCAKRNATGWSIENPRLP